MLNLGPNIALCCVRRNCRCWIKLTIDSKSWNNQGGRQHLWRGGMVTFWVETHLQTSDELLQLFVSIALCCSLIGQATRGSSLSCSWCPGEFNDNSMNIGLLMCFSVGWLILTFHSDLYGVIY